MNNDRKRQLRHQLASPELPTLRGPFALRDAAWDAVAARRDAEMESDASVVVPLDDALARLRAQFR